VELLKIRNCPLDLGLERVVLCHGVPVVPRVLAVLWSPLIGMLGLAGGAQGLGSRVSGSNDMSLPSARPDKCIRINPSPQGPIQLQNTLMVDPPCREMQAQHAGDGWKQSSI